MRRAVARVLDLRLARVARIAGLVDVVVRA